MKKAQKQKKVWSGIQEGTEDARIIYDSVQASYDVMREFEDCKAELNENFKEVEAKTGIPKRVWNFLVKANYFANENVQFEKNKELEDAWDAIQKVKGNSQCNMLDISEIKKISSQIDRDDFFLKMKAKVDSGDYESFIAAISAFLEEEDLSEKEIKELISPTLMGILEKEAVKLNLLLDSKFSTSRDIEDFLE